jgi:hypothetical protein
MDSDKLDGDKAPPEEFSVIGTLLGVVICVALAYYLLVYTPNIFINVNGPKLTDAQIQQALKGDRQKSK